VSRIIDNPPLRRSIRCAQDDGSDSPRNLKPQLWQRRLKRGLQTKPVKKNWSQRGQRLHHKTYHTMFGTRSHSRTAGKKEPRLHHTNKTNGEHDPEQPPTPPETEYPAGEVPLADEPDWLFAHPTPHPDGSPGGPSLAVKRPPADTIRIARRQTGQDQSARDKVVEDWMQLGSREPESVSEDHDADRCWDIAAVRGAAKFE